MWGCMLVRFVSGFLLFFCLGEYEVQVGKGGEYFFAEVLVQFCLEDRSHVLQREEDIVGGGDSGVRNLFVLEKQHA